MSSILSALIPVALLAVALILVVGLVNMMRGSNPNRSQRLMRWRVLLQLLAIVIVMASLYFLQ
ncbi:twin transmembrane helix small protein [uncultured Cohaesibacter sp.]|uniref:twin transmembrane helix small protein n=1 Tax=uncultured Cohaesibacter sp. TaxID=1002546 RepID=UPI002AAC1D10|nr:twin transmembrane helix small protein [uncultured Cohaesibacter sp.]